MTNYKLVKFDSDSTTFANQFAIQERDDCGDFVGLYSLDSDTLATRKSFPRASWSAVSDLCDKSGDESFNDAVSLANDYLKGRK